MGSDHGGFELKEKIKAYLDKQMIEYDDIGTYGGNPNDDYPDYAFKVADRVMKIKNTKGILICGSGEGMVIAANKVKGIRAAIAYDNYSAKMAKLDNNVNVLCLRERKFSVNKAKKIVAIWLITEFSDEARHKRRIDKISHYENKRK